MYEYGESYVSTLVGNAFRDDTALVLFVVDPR